MATEQGVFLVLLVVASFAPFLLLYRLYTLVMPYFCVQRHRVIVGMPYLLEADLIPKPALTASRARRMSEYFHLRVRSKFDSKCQEKKEVGISLG